MSVNKFFVGAFVVSALIKMFWVAVGIIAVMLFWNIFKKIREGYQYTDPNKKWGHN